MVAAEVTGFDKLKDDVTQIQQKVAEISAVVENDLPSEAGMSYLQVKNHALLTYTKMELFFALLKLEAPENVQDHPVFKELVRYRTLLERIRPLDRKLKYQVDKMLKVAVSGGKDMDESLNYAPNPDQLLGQDGQEDDDDDEEGGASAKDGIYRAPRLASVPYEEEEREQAKKAKKDERNRKRMQKSTILSELREEFSERPAEIHAGGSGAIDKEIAREEAEKKDYEESRFVRLVTSRKDKIRKRQREHEANRADNVGSIDNFAGVQDILSLDKSKHRIPVSREPAKIGGKTGGIFAHIEAPTEKKRKVPRSGGSMPSASSSAPSANDVSSQSTKSSSGKKKKVVYSNIFS
uniref:Neuroguidin n=1 Tax=Globisporangium ultimum (strain ATCC 200006 / CBS 805.95 / DAOM BR144) TaxID=431595 RepID=K3X1I0_GLOUD